MVDSSRVHLRPMIYTPPLLCYFRSSWNINIDSGVSFQGWLVISLNMSTLFKYSTLLYRICPVKINPRVLHQGSWKTIAFLIIQAAGRCLANCIGEARSVEWNTEKHHERSGGLEETDPFTGWRKHHPGTEQGKLKPKDSKQQGSYSARRPKTVCSTFPNKLFNYEIPSHLCRICFPVFCLLMLTPVCFTCGRIRPPLTPWLLSSLSVVSGCGELLLLSGIEVSGWALSFSGADFLGKQI